MPEPQRIPAAPDSIPAPRAPGNPDPGVISMRAATGADLSHARVLAEQALRTLPFLRVEPDRASLVRELLTRSMRDVARAGAVLADETFLPAADSGQAA